MKINLDSELSLEYPIKINLVKDVFNHFRTFFINYGYQFSYSIKNKSCGTVLNYLWCFHLIIGSLLWLKLMSNGQFILVRTFGPFSRGSPGSYAVSFLYACNQSRGSCLSSLIWTSLLTTGKTLYPLRFHFRRNGFLNDSLAFDEFSSTKAVNACLWCDSSF